MLKKLKNTTVAILIYVFFTLAVHSLGVGGYEDINEEDTTNIIGEEIECSNVVDEVEIEPSGVGTGVFSKPLEGIFTSGFGQRWGRLHGGIDLASETGTPIMASDDGTVIFTGDCGTYGLLVKIDHKNGYVTYYAHCSEIISSVGDLVEKGDVIALVGNTGNSTGPHCHFEIRYDNVPQNPLEFIDIEKAVS